MSKLLNIEKLKLKYGDKEILKDISLNVNKGEVVAIIGPSGSGKTTLLRSINFLAKPYAGTMTLNQTQINFEKPNKSSKLAIQKQTAMVFQQYNLFLNMTVLENIVEVMVTTRNIDRKEALSVANKLIKQVGLEEVIDHYPSQLSGGQQQRVGIIRALAVNPELLLLDEPTSSLDPELVDDILNIIRNVAQSGATMIIVTHEIGFAYEVADRIIFMDQGEIVEQGTPDEVIKHPTEKRTKDFLMMTKKIVQNLMV